MKKQIVLMLLLLTACSTAIPAQTPSSSIPSASASPPSSASPSPQPQASPSLAPSASATPSEFCDMYVFHTNQVKGRVTGPDGKPLAGIGVSLGYLEKAIPASFQADGPPGCIKQAEPEPQTVKTDADGNYLFQVVVIGPKIELSIGQGQMDFAIRTDSFVVSKEPNPAAGDTQPLYLPDRHDYKLEKAKFCDLSAFDSMPVSGKISDAAGLAIAGASIQFSMVAEDRVFPSDDCFTPVYEFTGSSDSQGHYRLPSQGMGLLPGRYRIRVSQLGFQTLEQVETIKLNHSLEALPFSFTLRP